MTHRLSNKHPNTRYEQAPFEVFVNIVQENPKALETIAITSG